MPRIVEFLNDADIEVRFSAATALGKISKQCK